LAFAYAAFDSQGKQVTGVIDAGNAQEATEQLHGRGLLVTEVKEKTESEERRDDQPRKPLFAGRAGNVRDLMLFSQQATMMLRAGSRVVPAMEAIESQISKPGWREIVTDIREKVETGAPLSRALDDHPEVFNETWRAIINAGESTGKIDEAFEQLSWITKRQNEIKVRVIGALVYPAALVLLALGVIAVLVFFVLPRFGDLYKMLNTQLPMMTQLMLDISGWALNHKLIVTGSGLAFVAAPFVVWRIKSIRRWFDNFILSVPLIGKLARQIILAKIFRIWGTSIKANVPLLESLELSRGTTTNATFRGLLDDITDSVSEGDTIGNCLMQSSLVPKTMSSAIATGEESGQLGNSLLFLAEYMEQENEQTLATLTRLIEPLILVVMGLAVGTVAISLFLPLFDLTSAM
jgi:type IV pilus assembly protein PilC